jgi:hypothetical protein
MQQYQELVTNILSCNNVNIEPTTETTIDTTEENNNDDDDDINIEEEDGEENEENNGDNIGDNNVIIIQKSNNINTLHTQKKTNNISFKNFNIKSHRLTAKRREPTL